jgi:hypothetical protein
MTTSKRDRRHYCATDDADAILAAAGPTMSVPEAGVCFGLGESKARILARRGEFPVRVLQLGSHYRVPTADVRRALGLSTEAEPVAERESA